MNPFSHIDLRVNNMRESLPFYEALLPVVGFTRAFHGPQWKVFAAEGALPSAAYFAITEDAAHKPSTNRIAFWAKSREDVDRLADVVRKAGGQITDGPELFSEVSPSYYAVYFEDPSGNRFEILHRMN